MHISCQEWPTAAMVAAAVAAYVLTFKIALSSVCISLQGPCRKAGSQTQSTAGSHADRHHDDDTLLVLLLTRVQLQL